MASLNLLIEPILERAWRLESMPHSVHLEIDVGSSDLQSLFSLSVAERMELAEELWDSVARDTEARPLQPHEQAAIELRRAEHCDDPDALVSWDHVKASLKL